MGLDLTSLMERTATTSEQKAQSSSETTTSNGGQAKTNTKKKNGSTLEEFEDQNIGDDELKTSFAKRDATYGRFPTSVIEEEAAYIQKIINAEMVG